MQQAPFLQKGDSIRIISTARKISLAELTPAIEIFKSWGLEVIFGKNLFQEHHQFAGTSEQRTEDLQEALNDKRCKAIICARGGYGTVQLVDQIDFTVFQENPKWLLGYSDVTVLHNHINQNFGIETLHANMPISFPKEGEDETTDTIRKALFGEELNFNFQLENESITQGRTIVAPVVGGNLSIIYSLTGTDSQLNAKGKFLFIEDLDEYLYHIDRMMMNLKRAGLFDGCKALLVGGMSDMNDNTIPYGKTAKEIILENVSSYGIPIIFGIPSGHIKRNLAMIMNREVELSVDGQNVKMTFRGRA
ncbi:MAG: LD-carboxypeptidase [Flavobacteriales bacterium]|nr:LD-carboxypeptidase [Flavobacteriales bacterium]